MEAFSRVKQAISQLEKSTSFIEAWNKLFRTGFDVASILYLHAFASLDDSVQLIHLKELTESSSSSTKCWWIYASVSQEHEVEMCRESTTKKTGLV
jgi:hypothetical protein